MDPEKLDLKNENTFYSVQTLACRVYYNVFKVT